MIKGAKGESIEEPEDLDKELTLLDMKLKTFGQSLKVDRSFESIANVFGLSIKPLLERTKEICEKFDRFYVSNKMNLEIDGRKSVFIKNQSFFSINDDIWYYRNTENITFEYSYNILKQINLENTNYISQINIVFDLAKYFIRVSLERRDNEVLVKEKTYSEYLTVIEIEDITRFIAQEHKKFVESKINAILKT